MIEALRNLWRSIWGQAADTPALRAAVSKRAELHENMAQRMERDAQLLEEVVQTDFECETPAEHARRVAEEKRARALAEREKAARLRLLRLEADNYRRAGGND